MRRARIANLTRDAVLAERAELADTFQTRLVGLLGRRELGPGEGLILTETSSVHMFFMQIALDIVFLDKDSRVLRVIENLKPWYVSPLVWGARTTLELPVGTIAATGTRAGDALEITNLG
jgi:uncharacterized protein